MVLGFSNLGQQGLVFVSPSTNILTLGPIPHRLVCQQYRWVLATQQQRRWDQQGRNPSLQGPIEAAWYVRSCLLDNCALHGSKTANGLKLSVPVLPLHRWLVLVSKGLR